MPTVRECCRHIRTKNAGPFWITLDLFFPDKDSFEQYANSPQLQPEAIANVFGVDAGLIKRFLVPDLLVLKISYARSKPQGGAFERDIHGGQQYVRLLDVNL